MCRRLCGFIHRLEVNEKLRKGTFVPTSVICKGTRKGGPPQGWLIEDGREQNTQRSLIH